MQMGYNALSSCLCEQSKSIPRGFQGVVVWQQTEIFVLSPPATYRQPDDNHDVGFFSDERTTYYTLAASGSDSSTILADETDPR
jgi:hypothetical protein